MKNSIIYLLLLSMPSWIMAGNKIQNQREDCLIRQYHQSCILIEKNESSIFKQGIELRLREKHTDQCWGGKADPNTSPVFRVVHIDRFGRMFEESAIENAPTIITKNQEKPYIINDIKSWKHPIKTVFVNHGIQLQQVKLFVQKTLPYFYIQSHPLLTEKEKAKQKKFTADLLKANGQWDFFLVDENKAYFIEGHRRRLESPECGL